MSHFSRINRQLPRFDKTVENICPSCGASDESPGHITRCKDPGRSQMFAWSVASIVKWLGENGTNLVLINLIERYLNGRGEIRMRPLWIVTLAILDASKIS